MSSLRRILASRANGALSKGPKTPEGKRRASANSLRHGLLADCIVLENESRPAFESLLACHLDRFGPVDGVEFGLLEEMTAAYWRMRRAWAIEKRIFEDGLARQAELPADQVGRLAAAFTNLAASPELALLHRYETRLHLIYQRGLHNLLLLRAYTPPAAPPPADTAPSLPPAPADDPADDTPSLPPLPSHPSPAPASPPPAGTAPCQTNLVPQTDSAPQRRESPAGEGPAKRPMPYEASNPAPP